ncbi:flagellar hook-associated protein FlgL [Roseateles violae]|uniref:Flagellar hook-associated protein FlgL n=1 Tax=Roseateles violae TaxID=3058042 RepID=A0ABT8DP68_9BURK|nr:flagellar hook-associated protein FlgL [Pelomonas sp. PFR6]MDN3919806.1 flagellar hook-associated protein FlgL [Pelomonas sp. PFR6]
MRLSTANLFDASITNLQHRQQQMQETQTQLTSGKRVGKASDDPTAAARAERALMAINRANANQRALEASRNSMALGESALGDANELLQQVREAMVAAGNASYSDAERQSLAQKVTGLRGQLFALANRSDGTGGFLFAGQGSGGAPFIDTPTGVQFAGTAGTAQGGGAIESYPLSVDGRSAWTQAVRGNGVFETGVLPNLFDPGAAQQSWIDSGRVTDPSLLTGASYELQVVGSGAGARYTVIDSLGNTVAGGPFASGKAIEFEGISITLTGSALDGDRFEIKPSTKDLGVFDVLDRLVSELKSPQRSDTQLAQANALGLRDLDAVLGNLQNARAAVGESLNNLDGSESRLGALKLYNESERSAAEDLDMISGIADFQNQQSGYDAALKTYASVQKMSLFQYINL